MKTAADGQPRLIFVTRGFGPWPSWIPARPRAGSDLLAQHDMIGISAQLISSALYEAERRRLRRAFWTYISALHNEGGKGQSGNSMMGNNGTSAAE